MLTQKTAESTTFASRESPASTDAQSEQSSRSETQMAQETAKIQKMFPDGKCRFEFRKTSDPKTDTHKSIPVLLIAFGSCNESQVLNDIHNLSQTRWTLFHTSNHTNPSYSHSHPHHPTTLRYFSCNSVILTTFLSVSLPSLSLFANQINKQQTRNNSEDYYGDLDLKSIRKSELLAGLANSDSRGNAAIAKTKNKKE